MKKILLIHPLVTEEEMFRGTAKVTPHRLPPLGLCWIASVLRENGFNVKIIDAEGVGCEDQDLLEKVVKEDPDYIGIPTTVISVFKSLNYVNMFRRELSPKTKIILGGPQISGSPETTMALFPQVDAGVLGEGEVTIVELIEAFERKESLDNVKGIIYRDKSSLKKTPSREFIKNLNDLPLPAWDLLPWLPETYSTSEITHKSLPSINLVTSRGCPNQCIFCDRSVFGRRWRYFNPSYIIMMIKELIKKYKIRDIYFNDDQFLVNKQRVKKLCQLIVEENIKLDWSVVGRIDCVDKETILLMKEAGCHQLEFGFESGSQKILNILKKNIRIEDMMESINIVKEAGLSIKGLFMVGNPGETEKTLKETKNFIEEMEIDKLSICSFTPLPATEIYANAHKYGEFEDNWKKMNQRTPIFIPWDVTKEMLEEFIGIYKR